MRISYTLILPSTLPTNISEPTTVMHETLSLASENVISGFVELDLVSQILTVVSKLPTNQESARILKEALLLNFRTDCAHRL